MSWMGKGEQGLVDKTDTTEGYSNPRGSNTQAAGVGEQAGVKAHVQGEGAKGRAAEPKGEGRLDGSPLQSRWMGKEQCSSHREPERAQRPPG